jgi:hypothetical protein
VGGFADTKSVIGKSVIASGQSIVHVGVVEVVVRQIPVSVAN